MTYEAAVSSLPAGIKWSASFGNPGEGGYSEYFRTPSGERYVVSNGSYEASAPFVWSAARAP